METPKKPTLLTPKPTHRILGGRGRPSGLQGENPLPGVILDYFLPEANDSLNVKLEIIEGKKVIRSYTNQKPKMTKTWPGGPQKPLVLSAKKGFNRMSWDLRKAPLPAVENVFVYGSYAGSTVPPGTYNVQLSVGDYTETVTVELLADPNINATAKDYEEQASLLHAIDQQIADIHNTVGNMREIQSQLDFHLELLSKRPAYESLYKKGTSLKEKLKNWERQLIQPDQKTFQDVINFNNKLNAEFMHLKGYVDSADPAVTAGAKERFSDLKQAWEKAHGELQHLIENEITSFNQDYRDLNIPSLVLPTTAK